MKARERTGQSYHLPVLASEVVGLFSGYQKPVIYDGTLGGGGHAEELLKSLKGIHRYIAVDRDSEAIDYSRKRLGEYKKIYFHHGIFDEIEHAMVKAGVDHVDGFFLDLGISSHQIDEDQRGFAYRKSLKLDMRMNMEDNITATDVLNSYSESQLFKIFKEYGEERFSRRIAATVVSERKKTGISTTDVLMKLIGRCVGPSHKVKSYARIFQALRIEVNKELEILPKALQSGLDHLLPGGRMVIISYHSLEDRIVKQFFRKNQNPCQCPQELPYCVCGKKMILKILKPEVRKPQNEEIRLNPRARSAKLRAGEKT